MADHAPVTPAHEPEVDIGLIATIGAVGTLLVILAVVLVQAFYYGAERQQTELAQAAPVIELQKYRASQLELLQGYLVPDPGKGTIHIPIDRAITIIAREGAIPPWPTSGQVTTGAPAAGSSATTEPPAGQGTPTGAPAQGPGTRPPGTK